MSQTLREIAEQLQESDKKVQLIYAFNGSGKTRLSREFKELVSPKLTTDTEGDGEEEADPSHLKILYYNAFTEDLFYWDNDLTEDVAPKLIIQPNAFTNWTLVDQGQDQNVITNFQRYTSDKLTPEFNGDFSEVTFSFERGNQEQEDNIKLSKGEESNFVWSVFYTLWDLVVETLNIAEVEERDTDQFNHLKYVFIDDPVSSLDENHLIELAVNIASIIKHSESELKFIITTHNPLFYNVLHNELRGAKKYLLRKEEDGGHTLEDQKSDSPFAYHLYLKSELETAIQTGKIRKYHYNYLRNLLEKTSTFLGYEKWADLLPRTEGGRTNPYETRMINLFSHSKHSAEEVTELDDDDKRMMGFLVRKINETYRFKSAAGQPAETAG
ncbi:AAA family ATPase [Desulfosediminicola flagellatus]|uniref:AAA family ATPase n=1 Tax=Desulfosediminicola flagellatus TaxID=2569541 RepID=UPI0010ABB0E5|nr:AAA family ATPase [Desulfosediminicola flagellatus]